MVLGQPGLGCGALDHDDLLAGQLGLLCDQCRVRGDHPEGDLHVGVGKVHLLPTFRRDGEIRQDDVHFRSLQELDPGSGLDGNVVHLRAEVLADSLCVDHVIARGFAVGIDIPEGGLVAENPDPDGAGGLDLVEGSELSVAG